MGWYVELSLNHYGCVTVYFLRIREERNCDTVEFFPNEVLFLRVSLDDFLKQVATDITTILMQPPSSVTPSLKVGDAT